MKNINSLLKFKNYVVDSVNFKTNLDFTGRDVDLSFDLNTDFEFEEDGFVLALEVSIFDNAKENDYPFSMYVKLLGLFEFDSSLNDETRKSFAERNSIAILFPYLRAMLSVYSSNSNIGTIVLPPINVIKYLENKKEKNIDKS